MLSLRTPARGTEPRFDRLERRSSSEIGAFPKGSDTQGDRRLPVATLGLMVPSPNQKLRWSGALVFVRPRIRLSRSFDQRAHSYLGFVLGLAADSAVESVESVVAIGPAAQAKHEFRRGDVVSGEGLPVEDPRLEPADIYKASQLRLLERKPTSPSTGPPWHGTPPPLEVYRRRGHRRLDPRTFDARCSTCIWGCRMAVEIVLDHWNPQRRKYRTETFCYGPLSCSIYRAGPKRSVPGRQGMTYIEEDWVDEDATGHRGPDE
jgi:hypothetical protein